MTTESINKGKIGDKLKITLKEAIIKKDDGKYWIIELPFYYEDGIPAILHIPKDLVKE